MDKEIQNIKAFNNRTRRGLIYGDAQQFYVCLTLAFFLGKL